MVAHSPFSHEDSMEYSKQYLAGHPATDPNVSPLLQSSFEGWPEMYLEWALDEFLAPDVAALHARFQDADLDVTMRTEPEAVHGWQLLRISFLRRGVQAWPWGVDSCEVGPSHSLIQGAQNQRESGGHFLFRAGEGRRKPEGMRDAQEPKQENSFAA